MTFMLFRYIGSGSSIGFNFRPLSSKYLHSIYFLHVLYFYLCVTFKQRWIIKIVIDETWKNAKNI